MDSFLINAFLHPTGSQTLLFLLIFAWSLFWKGLAFWRSAKSDDNLWFIAFLIVNTFGLLEIAYIFYLSKNKLKAEEIKTFFNNFNSNKLKKLLSTKKGTKLKKAD
jgi:hypothetical protein